MSAWTTTRLTVSEVNTLITAVSKVVGYCMSFLLAAVALEVRRLMTIHGEKDAIIQDERLMSIWKRMRKSKTRRWTALAALPVLLNSAADPLIGFTTSGVSASFTYAKGEEVKVLGLVGDGIHEDSPTAFPTVSGVALDAESDNFDETAYLTLLSSDLVSVGFSSIYSDVEVQHVYRSNDGEAGVFVYGNEYAPPISVSISFCVEISPIEEDNTFAIAECREDLIVDKATQEFEVLSLSGEATLAQECSQLYESIPLGNQGVGVVTRNLTFNTTFERTNFDSTAGTTKTVAATCSSIFESVIESCVWHDADAGVLYFGDWNVFDAGKCDNTVTFFPEMAVLGIGFDRKVNQDTAVFLAAMTAEVFAGTGILSSRQQLIAVLGAVIRLESMEWNLHTAYDPVDVVKIGVSLWVPVVLLLALLLPVVAWGVVKWRGRGKNLFLPVDPAEWSACAARALDSKHGTSPLSTTAKPLDEHFDQLYAFGPVAAADNGSTATSQRLGWVSRRAVVPAAAVAFSNQQAAVYG